jgi:sugar lactone lactonase YvrE
MKKTAFQKWYKARLFLLPFLLILLFFAISCKEEPISNTGVPFDPSKPITATSFSPDSGGVGTKLIIKGENFGNDPKMVTVMINGKDARVVGVNNGYIYAVVPTRADTGLVKVVVGTDSSKKTFEFTKKFNYIFQKNVSTLCGETNSDGSEKEQDGLLSEALFMWPIWLQVDKENNIFVVDWLRCLRKISLTTGEVSTLYRFSGDVKTVRAFALTNSQDSIIICNDQGSDQQTGLLLLTRQGGFMNPTVLLKELNLNAVTVNPVTGEIFYTKWNGGLIKRFNPKTGKGETMLTLFGNGGQLLSMGWSQDGTTAYISFRDAAQIHKASYNLSTRRFSNAEPFVGKWYVPGDKEGTGTEAQFDCATQLICDADGNLYFCDAGKSNCIRKVTPAGVMTTFAGTALTGGYQDGVPAKALFRIPEGICVGKDGVMYVADTWNYRIRKILVE